jgi:hypothetical protein
VIGFDAYDRGARLAPAYLVFAPAAVFVVAASLGAPAWWSKLGGILVACGGPMLAVEWGRAAGRRKQAALFDRWGGSPTTQLLQFARGGSEATVVQRHGAVQRATGIPLPSAGEEAADPAGATAAYENAVRVLRELTRDKTFSLVLRENISYGFRRNLWGRKPFGLTISGAAVAAGVVLIILDLLGRSVVSVSASVIGGGFGVIALAGWIIVVTPDWVRAAGDAYAERLIDSAIRLPAG